MGEYLGIYDDNEESDATEKSLVWTYQAREAMSPSCPAFAEASESPSPEWQRSTDTYATSRNPLRYSTIATGVSENPGCCAQ